MDLPRDLRSIVERQYSEILTAHDQIKSMRDSSVETVGSSARARR